MTADAHRDTEWRVTGKASSQNFSYAALKSIFTEWLTRAFKQVCMWASIKVLSCFDCHRGWCFNTVINTI